jgi:hypothetical protein
LSVDFFRDAVDHEAWRELPRHAIVETEKYVSIARHFLDGVPWRQTPLFRIYRERLAQGESVRGSSSIGAISADYNTRVTALFEDMKANGFRSVVDGRPTSPIPVYIGHDGEMLLSNQGNHRLAIAKILNLDSIVVQIVGRHPASGIATYEPATSVTPVVGPDLPESARAIPAMTTEAERQCYYRWALNQAAHGAVVELGAWLGAATAYIAAGVRDAGADTRAQVYDRFIWKPSSHDKKAGGPIGVSQLAAAEQGEAAGVDHGTGRNHQLDACAHTDGPNVHRRHTRRQAASREVDEAVAADRHDRHLAGRRPGSRMTRSSEGIDETTARRSRRSRCLARRAR